MLMDVNSFFCMNINHIYIYYIQPTIPYLGDNYLQHNCRDMSHNPHSIYIYTYVENRCKF